MSGYQDVPMTRRRAQLLEEYASKLADMLEAAPNDKDLAEWVQSKIDRAAAAIQSAYHYLDQDDESELEKAVGHKYTHRKLIGRDQKTGRARYRYYYAEHQGGGISRAKFEAGSAFKLTWKGRRGHFHIDRVEGDQVFITHDSRPNMEPVPVQADELRALLTKQHSKAEQKHVKKRQREVEEIKRRAHRGGLGLALHRLRQAAAQAGVSLPEQYQRKPKKTRAKVAETAREVEAPKSATLINETNFPTLPPDRRGAGFMTYGGETFRETPSIDGALFSFTPGTLDRWLRGKDAQSILEGIYRKTAEIAKQADPTADIEEEYESLVEYAEKNARRIYHSPFTDEAKKMSFALKDLQEALEKDKYKKDEPPLTILNEILATLNDLSSQAPTPRNQLKDTAQQIIEDANQEHAERHDEHQEITRFELGEHTHTKTGAKLFTAKQTERVDRDEYFRRLEIAKRHGGRYERRYVRGFVFKTAEDARAFALEVEGAAQEAPETSAETVTPHDEHPGADNFETMPEVESAGTPKRTVTDELNDIDSELFKELVLANVPEGARSLLEAHFSPSGRYVQDASVMPEWYTREVARALKILQQSVGSEGRVKPLGSVLTYAQISQLQEILRPLAEEHETRDYLALQKEMSEEKFYKLVVKSTEIASVYRESRDLAHYAATRDKESTPDTYSDHAEWTNADVQEDIKRLLAQTPPEQHARLWSEFINPQLRKIKAKGRVKDTPLTRAFKAEGWTPQGFFTRKDGVIVQLELRNGEPIRSDYEFKADRQGRLLARTRYKHYGVTHGDYIQYGKWKPAAELLTPAGLGYEEGTVGRALKRSKSDSLGVQRQMIGALKRRIPSEIQRTHKVWINQNGTEVRLYAKRGERAQDLSVKVEGGEYRVKHTKRGGEFWQTIQGELNKLLSDAPAQTPAPPPQPTTPREQLTATAREVTQGADNFETMPEVEAPAREQLAETVRNITAPSSPLDIDQANAQDTLTENRTRAPESKAADKALIESARELAKTSERGEEIKSALVDLMNAQQLKRYKRATGDTRARAEDMIEKRREARERLRAATSGEVINNFETMPEVETQPKKRSVKQEAREAQEARLIQQKTFDNETQGKITEVYSVLKDRVRLNKKGEVYAIKKPSTLYYGETPTGALAGAVSSATGLSRSAAYNIVNEAVGEGRTLAEIQDLLGAQIVEEKKELIRKRPAAIRMLIRNLHTNTREKIRTYTAQFNPAMRHDQRSGIGLESIDLALDKREIARNVSIYGTQDSVLTEEERRKVTYTTMMSAVSVVDRIAARYGNIAELRADAEGVKQTLETFARAVLESIKESAERDLRYVKGKIDAGVKDIKETDFKRDMLEARLTRAEHETSFLDDPEATREEIREIREGLDEAEQILREDTERTAQWYSAEAQRRLAENSVKTMGELTAAIKSGTARRYIEAAVEGSAKEKLAARIFNEIMERLLVETKDQPIEQPPLDTPEPVEKPEGRVSAIASVIDRQAEERAERRQRRLKDKQSALRKTPIHKSITEALVNSLVVESDHAGTQGPTIKKLTDSKQSAVRNILLKTIADTVGTETRGKARELLMKQALGLGGATTGESRRFDSMLVKIQEALTPQTPLARARREVEEIVKRTMVHNLSTSIEKALKRFVAPRTTTSANRPMGLPHYRDLPVPETPLRDYQMTALYGRAYDRLARKYLSGRELEADAAEIKAKTKQAFRQRLDAQRSRNRDKYNEAFLEATNPNRDTPDQRLMVLDHVQAMISTLGLESERGQAGVSLRDQVEQIKRTAERNRAGYQAEIDANAQKQAEDLRYLKEEIKPKIMGDQAPAAEAQLLQDYLNDIEDSHNRTGFETKRGRRFAEIQREALQELINELQSTPPKRISEFGEDLDARQSTDIRATAPARQALTETTERVTSDQTAEQATTRATPRPSEATLRGSGELDETVRANLQDRAQYLLRMPEDTTKTGRRSKAQKARDGELLLIHRRLQSDAQERLGPTAPRFADYSQLIGMPRADQPENAETRAQFRAALKDAIRELEQATSGQVTKSARPLITYRAQLIQTVERLTAA